METIPGDPDSQTVYVNKVGTFGVSCADRISAAGIRATHHLLGPEYMLGLEERETLELLLPVRQASAIWLVTWLRRSKDLCKPEIWRRTGLRLVFRGPGQAWRYEATCEESGGRLQRPDVGVEGDIPHSLYTDAKAENGR